MNYQEQLDFNLIKKLCGQEVCLRLQGALRNLESTTVKIVNTGMVSSGKSSLYNLLTDKVKIERNKVVISEEELSERIGKAVLDCISEVCAEEAIKSTDKIQNLEVHLTGIGELKTKQESIPYEYTFVTSESRPPKSMFEKLGSKILHKEYYTSASRTETRYSVFEVGINDTEITQNIMFKLEDVFRNTVSKFINSIVSGYYQPIEELQVKSMEEIRKAMDELTALKL